MSEKIKTIKGFDHELKCLGMQYEIGKTYTLPEGEKIKMCGRGFHAITPDETPLRVFDYYPPCDENGNPARYCEVEVGGETDYNDEKIVGSELTVGAEIGIPGLVKAHIEWVKRHLIDDDEHKSHNTGDRSSASNTGFCSSASNTGDRSSASNTGDRSSASNTGDRSSASNTGYCSSASNTGYCSSASNTGDRSSASNTGYCSSASNTGNYSSASVNGKESVAIVTGRDSKAKGAIGCWLVLTERDEDYHILGMQCFKVDGETIKADTWYQLKDGKVQETE